MLVESSGVSGVSKNELDAKFYRHSPCFCQALRTGPWSRADYCKTVGPVEIVSASDADKQYNSLVPEGYEVAPSLLNSEDVAVCDAVKRFEATLSPRLPN